MRKPATKTVMFTSIRQLDAFSASYACRQEGREGFNICVPCLRRQMVAPAAENIGLSALGKCSHCSTVTDVYDLDLLKLYRAFGLETECIREAGLPLLRQDFPHRDLLTETKVLLLLERLLMHRSITDHAKG